MFRLYIQDAQGVRPVFNESKFTAKEWFDPSVKYTVNGMTGHLQIEDIDTDVVRMDNTTWTTQILIEVSLDGYLPAGVDELYLAEC